MKYFLDERSAGIYGIEFNCVFTNNGGQAVILSIPHLRRRDTIALLSGSDLLEINSIVFATPASTRPKVIGAPSLGVYQTAPGQLAMFDVVMAGQCSSTLGTAYRAAGRSKFSNHSTPAPSPRLQQRLAKSHANADTGLTPRSQTPKYFSFYSHFFLFILAKPLSFLFQSELEWTLT